MQAHAVRDRGLGGRPHSRAALGHRPRFETRQDLQNAQAVRAPISLMSACGRSQPTKTCWCRTGGRESMSRKLLWGRGPCRSSAPRRTDDGRRSANCRQAHGRDGGPGGAEGREGHGGGLTARRVWSIHRELTGSSLSVTRLSRIVAQCNSRSQAYANASSSVSKRTEWESDHDAG